MVGSQTVKKPRARGRGGRGQPGKGRPGKGRRGALAGLRRWVGRALVAIVMTPIILVPLYTAVPPVSTLMIRTAIDGEVDRRWMALDDMAPVLVASVLMSEDGRFCAHGGVDWEELSRVLDSAAERPRGASTITMQTVKNVFLWQNRSLIRKAIEIPLAMFADTVWGKRRTMEIYLNVVEWGPGVFGAEAAAQSHFGRSAADLSASQAALMATALPNPAVRDPGHPSVRHRQLAATVGARARASAAYTDCLKPAGSL